MRLKPHSFEIHYKIDYPKTDIGQINSKRPIVTALTTHVCIDVNTQRIQNLSAELLQWIETVGTPIEMPLETKPASTAPND